MVSYWEVRRCEGGWTFGFGLGTWKTKREANTAMKAALKEAWEMSFEDTVVS